MRAAIEKLPDGVYHAITHIDGYLDSADPAHKNLAIEVTATVAGSDRDLSDELGEKGPALCVVDALLALDLGPFVMASHESSPCPAFGASVPW